MTGALNTLARGAQEILDRPLTPRELAAFTKYMILLIKWQKSQRLIGSSEPGWIVENVFLDSLLFLRVLPPQLKSLIDLGSGAGLPGIPIKIVRPEMKLVLIEARRRRASFLSNAVRELGLEGVRVMNDRAEELAAKLAGRFDAVALRCAGDAGLFLIAAEFVAPGGMVVASGPPRPRPLSHGEWVSVESWETGKTRRFAVYRRA